MVDSINNKPKLSSVKAQASNQRISQLKSVDSPQAARSGADKAAKEIPAAINLQKKNSSVPVGKLADNLQDAVRFSREALRSIEGVADTVGQIPDSGIGAEFAEEVGKLRTDLQGLLTELQSRADTAGIISANIEAEGPRIEDVERAQAKAQSTKSVIQFQSEQALAAHSITPETVERLLS